MRYNYRPNIHMPRALFDNMESGISVAAGAPEWMRVSPFRHKIKAYAGAAGHLKIDISRGPPFTAGNLKWGPMAGCPSNKISRLSGDFRVEIKGSETSRGVGFSQKYDSRKTQKLKTPGVGAKFSGFWEVEIS